MVEVHSRDDILAAIATLTNPMAPKVGGMVVVALCMMGAVLAGALARRTSQSTP